MNTNNMNTKERLLKAASDTQKAADEVETLYQELKKYADKAEALQRELADVARQRDAYYERTFKSTGFQSVNQALQEQVTRLEQDILKITRERDALKEQAPQVVYRVAYPNFTSTVLDKVDAAARAMELKSGQTRNLRDLWVEAWRNCMNEWKDHYVKIHERAASVEWYQDQSYDIQALQSANQALQKQVDRLQRNILAITQDRDAPKEQADKFRARVLEIRKIAWESEEPK